jgi:hypothetical protein
LDRQSNRTRSLERQIARVVSRRESLNRLSSRYSWARLITFLAGSVSSFIIWREFGLWLGAAWISAWLGGFSVLARVHNRVKDSIARHVLWQAIKTEHVARMALDWPRLSPALFPTPRPDCLLELDLDLVGEHGLHRLIDTCVSREGSARLRDWLAAGEPDPQPTGERQALVRELVPLPIFRDKLRLNAMLSSGAPDRRWRGDRLIAWLASLPPSGSIRPPLIGLTALAGLNVVLLVLNALAGFPALWRFSFLVYFGLYLWRVLRLDDPFTLALALRDPLHDLKAVFAYLETYSYGDNHALRQLCTPFLEAERCPSTQLARVTRVLAAASVRRNPMLWMIFSVALPWDLYVVDWLNRSRAALAERLPEWLDVWFELEALCSLANLAYLKPAYVFPDFGSEMPVFEARDMGHPLIPDGERVCNDFVLNHPGEMAVITGSNMSGKSTFLRTIGVNQCLAYAGGPVNARFFRTAPLRIFTCIRVTDSLTDGISYFYAEVKRLKALLVALEQDHPYSLLFLIDEIFRGTNNRERLIGSRAYVRALVGQNGVGVLSTHDLELVRLADDIPSITNYHFAETIADGRMTFDYTLRPGPCPTTNALKIMKMEGLPVDYLHEQHDDNHQHEKGDKGSDQPGNEQTRLEGG